MMKRLRHALLVVATLGALSGCATLSGPEPITREQLLQMSRAGDPPAVIISRLRDSGTVLPLSGSEIVYLHSQGVAPEVLDYLQQAQIAEIRRRDMLLYSGCIFGPRYYTPYASWHYPFSYWGAGPWGPC